MIVLMIKNVLVMCMFIFFFFFFNQMTAYDMRISDCSSDVCSSDLAGDAAAHRARQCRAVERDGDLHGGPHCRPAVAAAIAAPVLARKPEGAAGRRPDARPVPAQGARAGGSGGNGGHDGVDRKSVV